MNILRYFLALSVIALSAAAPASAQYACTTNHCISSQSTSFQTPPGWPAVPVETCCQTHWGALPGGIDWNNGAPVMICTGPRGIREHFPQLRRPEQFVAGVSVGLRPADLRHWRRLADCEGLPLRNAKHSTYRRSGRDLRRIFEPSGSSHELVGVRAQGAETRVLRLHCRRELPKGREGLLRSA